MATPSTENCAWTIGDLRLTGLLARAAPEARREDLPVIVAIHGAGYTAEYFDIPGYSLLQRASERGFDIVAVNRPGYAGSTALTESDALIQDNADVLLGALPQMLAQVGLADRRVVLLGHSVGGAVVLSMAAGNQDFHLVGVVVSGLGLEAAPASLDAMKQMPKQYFVQFPSEIKDAIMFGPEESRNPDMPAASHVSDSTAPLSELMDINIGWPKRFPALASQITVPVHFRHAELDVLWAPAERPVPGFAEKFANAERVDGGMIMGVGHCIDLHKIGASFQDEQLDFAESLALHRGGAEGRSASTP